MTKRPIFYDTETTGIKPEKDRIIEIAAYDPTREKRFHTLVNPEIPIPKAASDINHITDDMVEKSPTFGQAGIEFTTFCDGEVVLIAHNNDAFDLPFMRTEFKRSNLTFPPWPFIDSLKFARKYRPDLPRHSLQHLREYHGIPANNAHRALDDVIILHKVFTEMVDDLTMETILKIMTEKKALRRMPFGKYRGQPLEKIPARYVQWLIDKGTLEAPHHQRLRDGFKELGMI